MAPSSTATISLKLESKDFAARANDASSALLGVQLAAGGTGIALKGMGALARSSAAEFTLGAVAVDKFNTSLGKAATNAGKISSIAGNLSNLAYNTALATTAISGLVEATVAFNRIPQTLASITASGVNTQTIEEFGQMREAIGGNQIAVEGFVNTAIARLGQFEQAAARSATILKSSTRFDDAGNALRVNGAESLANALSIQQLVTTKLDNAVTSSSALLAQYEVLSAGFANQADSEKVLETALKLTQIGQAGGVASNAGDNAKLLGKSLQAYNLGAGDAARTGAILNAVVENGITTIPELSNGFGAAGSSAAKAGISMSALGAGVAQLTSLGQDTSEALTGLKGLSDAIINKTPEAAAELAKLSLNGQRIRFDIAEVQAKGLVQALLDVNKAAGNSPQILAKIFPDAVTSRAVTGLISGGGAGFKARFDAINGASAASLDEVAALASDTRVNKMEKLANKFGEIVISIAQSVAPVVEPGLDALKRIADGFAAIPEPIKQALGAWIAAQITAQSAAAGLGILVKTLGDLAGIYAIGRITSLAFTGQLGSELTVIKELIVQRKGLASVLLQTIGINQRHRLSVDAATAALTNQGIVAKGAYAAQAKGTELLAAASTKARSIFAQNVAGARAAAAEFAQTPTAGRTVNTALGIRARVDGVAAAVANSQTGQNVLSGTRQVRNAVGGFLQANPAIGTAASELKSVGVAAIGKIQQVTGVAISGTAKAATAARASVADPDAIPDPWADAPTKIGNAIGEGVNKTRSAIGKVTSSFQNSSPTQDPRAARLQQLIDAELQLNQAKLLTAVSQTRAKFAEIDRDTAFRLRLQDSKKSELAKAENSLNNRSRRLEEIRPNLSDEAYQKGVTKLNRDAAKIEELRSSIKDNATPLSDLQRERARLNRQLIAGESQLATANIAAQQRFTPLVNLESRLQRVNAAADRAQTRAANLETYAANINRIAPDSPQAIAANNAAVNAAIRQTSLAGRAQALETQYQTLLTSTGARTALLAQQGLAQVRFGGNLTTYNNSGLEKLLYADVNKAITGAIGLVPVAFTYVTTNATRAAVALGTLAKTAVLQPLGTASIKVQEYVSGLFGRVQGGLVTAFKEGGLSGVVRTGFDRYISGTAGIGQRALPFLPPQIAGGLAPIAVAAGAGALILRDDLKRGQLAAEFRDSVDATLKKDNELRAKYEDRSRPFAEIKAAVAQVSADKNFEFTQPSQRQGTPVSATASGVVENTIGLPDKAIGTIGSLINSIGGVLNSAVAPKFNPDGTSAIAGLDPVRDRLKLLAQSGQLTTDQFKDLDKTLAQMGKSGKISAEELAKFTAKLDGIKSQEKPQAKGVVDSIGNALYNTPGFIGNLATGTIDSLANGIGSLITLRLPSEVAKNREADSLISYLGDGTKDGSLTALTNRILDARIDTTKILATYRTGGALDVANTEKLKQGQELTSGDLEREKLQTTSRIDRNNALVSDYDTKLKSLNEQLEKQKDPGNRALLKNAIDGYTAQKDAILKNTEALKSSEAAFTKYNAETLPGLVRALKETQDPTKAVGLAAEDFNNIYQKDSTGATTAYVKDIAQLRAESVKYVEAIGSKYAIDNSASAESEAIAGLKTARDNRITLPNGDSGMRETVANRINLTDQIVKIQQVESQRIIATKTLETEKLKVLTSSGSLAEQEARIKTADISIEIAQKNLETKQKEIEEYREFPRKVVELEQQAATMRVQLEQQVADKQRAIREREFALSQSQFDLNTELLKTAQAELKVGNYDAIYKNAQITIAKENEAIEKLYQDRARLTEPNQELDDRILAKEQNILQTRASFRTQLFDAQQQRQKQQLDNATTARIQPITVDNKQLEIYQKVGELQSNIISANREILQSNLDIQQSQLNNESKLANNIVDRARIELTGAKAKLANLDIQAAYERESLIISRQLVALSLQAQQNQLKISRIEQERTIKELELQRLKLDRDTSNSPEIKAAREELEFKTKAAKTTLQSIEAQTQVLAKQGEVNRTITEAKLKQNTAVSANAKETERINVLLADINVKTSRITQANERQNLVYTAQTQTLTARSNILDISTKRLENQTKLLSAQQGLVNAIGDARVGELGIMTNLTTIESVKLDLAQRIATVKLSSLTAQIGYEKDILELNIQQQKASFEQDKLKQQISEKNAEREILNSRAAYEKLLVKGKLADPNEVRAAELDLSAKLDNQALVRSNRDILAQQKQFIDYSAQVERIKLDLKQKGELQGALANYGAALPQTAKANFETDLFNSIARQEGAQYYKDWADGVAKQSQTNPIALPQFNSPYDSRSNYNRPGVADPTKLVPAGSVLRSSGAGSVDFQLPAAPAITPIDTERYQRFAPVGFPDAKSESRQRDAQARYREFVANPVKIEISPQVRESQQQGRRQEAEGRREEKPVKPIVINLQMTNDLKIQVANSGEAKSKVEENVLGSIEDIARRIKERY